MTELALIEEESGSVRIHTAVGKIAGQYPKDFLKNGGENEQ